MVAEWSSLSVRALPCHIPTGATAQLVETLQMPLLDQELLCECVFCRPAARRSGASVLLNVDWTWSKYPNAFSAALTAPGVEGGDSCRLQNVYRRCNFH